MSFSKATDSSSDSMTTILFSESGVEDDLGCWVSPVKDSNGGTLEDLGVVQESRSSARELSF